ncbi:MAG TPA: hypothetical protein VHC97_01015 [Thermoanaerobaculia bacterium]|jgi:hypothetical protein|nr:hypothetical protein [Thermoanaerobaculia bacterium]
MTTKDLIKAEIDRVEEERLDELYDVVKLFSRAPGQEKPSLMSRLREIKIDAPEDFSTNLDLYMSGEKRADPDPG